MTHPALEFDRRGAFWRDANGRRLRLTRRCWMQPVEFPLMIVSCTVSALTSSMLFPTSVQTSSTLGTFSGRVMRYSPPGSRPT